MKARRTTRTHSKTHINSAGYRVFNDSGKSVHRWAAEKKLGRELRSGEVVHHIDRNKLNNSAGNLYVFANQQAHSAAHQQDARKYGNQFSYTGK